MKTLLVITLTLTLLTGALVTIRAQDTPGCDPKVDPTCRQQCPRDGGECTCTWEPDCTWTPPPGKPKLTGTPEAGRPDPVAVLAERMRTIDFKKLLEGSE